MAIMTGLYTRKEFALLPEGFPAQLVEGALVCEPSPAFGHQRIALELAERLKSIVGARRMGMAPLDIHVDEFNVYQPDVVVWREPLDDDVDFEALPPPLLVVEVLSPPTRGRDRNVKRIRLLDKGVEEVWLVDRENRTIEVFDRGRYADVPRRATGDFPHWLKRTARLRADARGALPRLTAA